MREREFGLRDSARVDLRRNPEQLDSSIISAPGLVRVVNGERCAGRGAEIA